MDSSEIDIRPYKATGGDPSHAPARHAYEKAGFGLSLPSLWMCRAL